MMPLLPENLSGCSLEEVMRSETENRAWHKELRRLSAALVNSRLAKSISLDEYVVNRKRANDDAAECRRRGTMLAQEIFVRQTR
jgi:hypothetical protein